MDVLPLDQQKKAVLYAPKELLWKIIEEESAWLTMFKVLPEDYYTQFLARLRLLGVKDKNQMRNMAKVYVQNKVRLDHLQEAVALVWKPSDLEDSTSWLKANGFLNRPLMPLNLQATAESDSMDEEWTAEEVMDVVAEAQGLSYATRVRLARMGKGSPKVGNPPDGASAEASTCWNAVLKDTKKRKMIMAPKSEGDQWALAIKFWAKECAKRGVPMYVSPAGSGSFSMHANNTLVRSLSELHNGLCYDGYTMSRPASRLLKQLFDQLSKDGYDMGTWNAVRPKNTKGR